ncbi:hypothetical protein REPUB_Repub08aG0133000 [Reevesia pubescens]
MKRKGIKKMAGASNTEINNQVYTFLAGDHSHPQSKAIYEKLDVLVGKMKGAGYVPKLTLHFMMRRRKTRNAIWLFTLTLNTVAAPRSDQ